MARHQLYPSNASLVLSTSSDGKSNSRAGLDPRIYDGSAGRYSVERTDTFYIGFRVRSKRLEIEKRLSAC